MLVNIVKFEKCNHQNKTLDFTLGEEIYYYCSDCSHELLYLHNKLEKAWYSELGPLRKIATARKGVLHFLMKLNERKIMRKD